MMGIAPAEASGPRRRLLATAAAGAAPRPDSPRRAAAVAWQRQATGHP